MFTNINHSDILYSFNSNLQSKVKNYFYTDNLPKMHSSNMNKDIKSFSNIFSNINLDQNKFKNKINGNEARLIELKAGLSHFKKLPLQNKIFGTGWYSSRIDITKTRNEIIDKYSENELPLQMTKSNKVDLQGIVALLLDTGDWYSIYLVFIFYISTESY